MYILFSNQDNMAHITKKEFDALTIALELLDEMYHQDIEKEKIENVIKNITSLRKKYIRQRTKLLQ